MPLTDDGFDPRDEENIRQIQFNSLENFVDNPKDDEYSFWYALFSATGQALEENQEQDLQNVYHSGYIEDAEGEHLTKKARELGVDRLDAQKATGVVTFSREEPAPSDFVIQEATVVRTRGDTPVRFVTTENATISEGDTEADVTIEAVDGGVQGNVAAETISAMPSPPDGIDDVINTNETGDPELIDTNDNPLRRGTNREDDEELRERTLESTSIGGAASVTAIESALRELDIQNLSIIPNATSDTVDGLDPYSTEIVVYGGGLSNIAETLKETMAVTDLLRLQNGVHGEAESYTVPSDVLDEDIEVRISRPLSVELTIDIEVVTEGNYVGDNEVRDRIVEYIGGLKTTGESVMGTGVGIPVYINKLGSYITDSVDDETGIVGISDITITVNGENAHSTDDNGLEIIDIQENEVATVDDALFDISVNEI